MRKKWGYVSCVQVYIYFSCNNRCFCWFEGKHRLVLVAEGYLYHTPRQNIGLWRPRQSSDSGPLFFGITERCSGSYNAVYRLCCCCSTHRGDRYLTLSRTLFILAAWVKTQKKDLKPVWGNDVLPDGRDPGLTGAAELPHCWTGYTYYSLSSKRVRTTVYSARAHTHRATGSLLFWLQTLSTGWIGFDFTGVLLWICCCQSLVHFRTFAILQVWITCQSKYSSSRVGFRHGVPLLQIYFTWKSSFSVGLV